MTATPDDPENPKDLPTRQGTNQSGMRARNERLVLSLVRRNGALSKSELARLTGLSAQTVSVIMRALENDGLFKRGEPKRGRVGQPSVPMALNPDAALFYGLKIGRRSIDLVLIDFLGNIVERISAVYSYPALSETLIFAQSAFEQIQARLSKDQKPRVVGLGIAMPYHLWEWAGPFDVPKGDMDAWKGVDLKKQLSEKLGIPVYVQNDATAACGAELVFGTQGLLADFMYLYLGYFIGGGVVLGHKLCTGLTGNAGAFGAMPVLDDNGKMVQLLDVASLSDLEKTLIHHGQDASQIWLSSGNWNVDRNLLRNWSEHAGRAIAQAVVSATCTFDFPTVVIEGWMPPTIKSDLVQDIKTSLSKFATSGVQCPDVIEGDVGPDARSLGAASLPLLDRYLLD